MNQKLGDHILFFLFSCINSHHAAKVFRDCWPIYDKKVEAQFRNIAFEWFKCLSQCEDFNLSPSLVVSKAAVMPTSNKFMMTIYSLCRFALHSKIVQKDPSENILLLPVLATKVDQRQNAMKLIHKSKLYHHYEYIKAVKERTEILEAFRDKAKNLVNRYKSTFEKRESSQNESRSLLEKSAFLSSALKERLPAASFQEFKSEIEKDITKKNEEIQGIWSKTSQLKRQDEESWPLIESIIVGNKGIFTISGKDYPNLVNLPLNDQLSEKEECYLIDCYRGGILNLVPLFRLSSYAFKLLHDSINDVQGRNVDKEGFTRLIESLQNQSKCVKSLKEDAQKLQSTLDGLLSSLLHSVMKLRQRIGTQYSVAAHSDSFALAPPTPSFNLDRSSTQAIPEFELQYHLIKLTPSCNETSNVSHRSLNSFSQRKTVSQCVLSKSVSRTLHSFQEYASPPLPATLANTRCVSSNRFTLDSGCVLSCGTDSLLQSLEKLDVTPKRNRLASFQNDFYQTKSNLHKNSLLNTTSFYKKSNLRKRQSRNSPSSFLSSCRSNSLEEIHDGLSTPPNLKSLNIEANSSPIFNKSGGCLKLELSLSYQGVPSDEVVEEKNKLNTGNYYSHTHEPIENVTSHLIDSDILNKSREMTSVARHDIKLSPLVSKLLIELQTDCNRTVHSGSSKFGMFARDFGQPLKEKSNQLPSLSQSVASVKSQVNNPVPTDRRKIETISSSFGKGITEQCSKEDVEERFHSQMSSLEAWFAREDHQKNSAYDLDSSCSTKVFSSGSRDLNILAEEDEEFVDGRSFLEEFDCRKNAASKFLSNNSPFDTVTEALISGELDSDLLLNKEVDSEIRRESLDISRRDSVFSLGHRGEGVSTRLSQIFKNLSLEEDNIFDESESCLLSSSCDEF